MESHAYIIAGPNGAGKTTFAREFLPAYVHCREFLNADLLAAGISPFDPDTAAISAGRILLARMKELIRQGKDFGFETTFAGKSYLPILRGMKKQGYQLHLYYLWLPNVDMAVARVAKRVEIGGHNIQESVIRRRFVSGIANLFQVYLPLMDEWFLFDNSVLHPHTVAHYAQAQIEVRDDTLYKRIWNVPIGNAGEQI